MAIETVICNRKKIPKLIFGTLTMAPIQRNMTAEEGGDIISAALAQGLRWIDTAQMYGSYPHVKDALDKSKIDRKELVISTKSTAKTYEMMSAAIDEALSAMNLEYIDLFLLHAVRSNEDFYERSEALQAVIDAKHKGVIGEIGISTHSTKFALEITGNEIFDWYHLMFNMKGTGLTDGTLKDQETAIKKAKIRGAKIYAMKPLGGGYLGKEAEKALQWINRHKLIDAVALGIATHKELEMNLKIFSGEKVSESLKQELAEVTKKLLIFQPLCIGCSLCAETCEQGAITIAYGKASVNTDKCILCGYCVPTCPKFAIRII
ncbi:MAG: aldo/keto reductase [Spirochaetes bacterium]|nr:aldo/keto reductase [Spirochaetota bacterium]